jgi:hypothetical protein
VVRGMARLEHGLSHERVLAVCPEEVDLVLELQLKDKVLMNRVVGRRFVDAIAEAGEAG